jgi:hypothetical protein
MTVSKTQDSQLHIAEMILKKTYLHFNNRDIDATLTAMHLILIGPMEWKVGSNMGMRLFVVIG